MPDVHSNQDVFYQGFKGLEGFYLLTRILSILKILDKFCVLFLTFTQIKMFFIKDSKDLKDYIC